MIKKLGKEVAINEEVQTLRSVLSEHELINIIHTASSNCREQILISNFTSLHPKHQKQSLLMLYVQWNCLVNLFIYII
jgi:hypothetical protein